MTAQETTIQAFSLSETLLYAPSRLWMAYVSTSFCKSNEIWRGFSLLLEKLKRENHVVCFAGSPYRGSTSCPGRETPPAQLLPRETHSASQHSAAIALNCVGKHLCFISIYFVHLLERCVLRYWKSLRSYLQGLRNTRDFSV